MTFLSARRLRTTGNSTNNRLSYRLFFVNNSSAILLEMFPLRHGSEMQLGTLDQIFLERFAQFHEISAVARHSH